MMIQTLSVDHADRHTLFISISTDTIVSEGNKRVKKIKLWNTNVLIFKMRFTKKKKKKTIA